MLGKRMEEGRLLLTVNARQGAVLATFTERVSEIDLLVDVGDTISLGITAYEPFIDDPAFRGVRKASPPPASGTTTGMRSDVEVGGATDRGSGPTGSTTAGETSETAEGSGDHAAEDTPPLGLPRTDQEAAGDTLGP